MVEIEFSYIHDVDNDERIWAAFIDEFRIRHGVKVHLREMDWDHAWVELFAFTSNDKGPQVSHVGNTWVNSLARLNVLRRFKSDEISSIGGSRDFVAANWETGMLPGDRRLWAIPWTAWIYVICYRKDLLQEAGIDPLDAFGTIESVKTTLERLAGSSLEIPWLNPQLPVSYRDLPHIASSLVWAAGGDLIDKEATKVLFNSPQAIDGLKAWLDIYRAVPAPYKKLSGIETFELFSAGRVAAMLANIRAANSLIEMPNSSIVRNNLGVASITETPWTGGGSFVIWDHVSGNPQKELAAVELVKFLSSKEINLRYHQETASMPSRLDALNEIYPQGNPAREAVILAATKGRGYYNIPVWRRIEQQLSGEMSAIIDNIVEDSSVDSAQILHKHLDPLAERLNSTLRN